MSEVAPFAIPDRIPNAARKHSWKLVHRLAAFPLDKEQKQRWKRYPNNTSGNAVQAIGQIVSQRVRRMGSPRTIGLCVREAIVWLILRLDASFRLSSTAAQSCLRTIFIKASLPSRFDESSSVNRTISWFFVVLDWRASKVTWENFRVLSEEREIETIK